jgi:hypothetical protein
MNQEINLIQFLQSFASSDFEFVISNQSPLIDKILSYQSDFSQFPQNIRNQNIASYLKKIFPFHNRNIDILFTLFPSLVFHAGIDSSSQRAKLYISLYDIPFPESIKLITCIRKIFSIQQLYKLEKNFVQFDCIGIDFTSSSLDLKIYELIQSQCMYEWIPDFINFSDIKQVWYLKSTSGRKKKFFRFLNKPSLALFEPIFDINWVDIFQEKIKDFYSLKKLVKYYCIEWDKKEIYFI